MNESEIRAEYRADLPELNTSGWGRHQFWSHILAPFLFITQNREIC